MSLKAKELDGRTGRPTCQIDQSIDRFNLQDQDFSRHSSQEEDQNVSERKAVSVWSKIRQKIPDNQKTEVNDRIFSAAATILITLITLMSCYADTLSGQIKFHLSKADA